MSPDVMTFEEFATRNGAGRADLGDPGLHHSAGNVSAKVWARKQRAQAEKDAQWQARRDALRVEFARLIETGVVREPSGQERLQEEARGEGPAAEAARRVLAKRAERAMGI